MSYESVNEYYEKMEKEFVDTGIEVSEKSKEEFEDLGNEQYALYLKEMNIQKMYVDIAIRRKKVWDALFSDNAELNNEEYIYKIKSGILYCRKKKSYEK